jgi:hypothetical protein
VLLWTLGNIAAEGYACLLIKENVHLKLLEMVLTTQDLPLLTAATYCLSHLCADLRTLDDKARVFGALQRLLEHDNSDVLIHTCKALHTSFKVDLSNCNWEICNRLLRILNNTCIDVGISCLETLVIITSTFSYVHMLADSILARVKLFFEKWETLTMRQRELLYFVIIDFINFSGRQDFRQVLRLQLLLSAGMFTSLAQTLQKEIYLQVAKDVTRALKKRLSNRWMVDKMIGLDSSGIYASIEQHEEKREHNLKTFMPYTDDHMQMSAIDSSGIYASIEQREEKREHDLVTYMPYTNLRTLDDKSRVFMALQSLLEDDHMQSHAFEIV